MACLDVAAKERLAALCQLEKIPVLWDEPMKNHTSFKIGGPAAALCAPKNRRQLRELVGFVQREGVDSWYIGNGSNLLISDAGLNGVAILLDSGFDGEIELDGTVLLAPAGKKLSAVCAAACAAGLTGLEFAYGIPGSVGGAVYMNAGAYGGEMKDRLLWVEYLAPTGEIVRLQQEQLSLSYRHSRFMEEGMQGSCIVRLRAAKGREGGYPVRDGPHLKPAPAEAAAGIPQRGQHLQASARRFCGAADRQVRAERFHRRRRTGE